MESQRRCAFPGRARTIAGVALAACASLSADCAMADQDTGAPAPRFVSLTIDNDFFAGADSHYTNGFQVAWTRDRELMFAVGQRMYTPTNKAAVHPDPLDRPYAGWLYLLADLTTRSDNVIDHMTFSIGVIGPASLARQTQSAVHHVLGTDRANGWDSQLGTEPALMAAFERTWPKVLAANDGRWDVALRAGATLGNVLTYANAGIVARWGRNLPNDIPVNHISIGPPRDGYRGAALSGWYAWLGLDGRAVARNVFLDGNTWKDSPGVDRKPFGYDVQLGMAAAWRSGRLGFTFVRRSPEFTAQKKADRFGQLTVSFPY
jgi:hypothetical protein